jgi:uncharacterized protein YjiS (DUF1127 family)
MIRIELTTGAARRPSQLAAWSGRALARAWQAFWRWRARQATVAILSALDDRALADIGMSRVEIESFVHGTPGERLRRYDEFWRRHYC